MTMPETEARYQIHLLPRDAVFKETELAAALNAGAAFPNRCQVGA